MKDKVSEYENKNKTLEKNLNDKILKLKEQNEKLNEDNENLEKDIDLYKEKINDLENTINNLNHELKNNLSDKEQHKINMSNKDSVINQLKNRINTLT